MQVHQNHKKECQHQLNKIPKMQVKSNKAIFSNLFNAFGRYKFLGKKNKTKFWFIQFRRKWRITESKTYYMQHMLYISYLKNLPNNSKLKVNVAWCVQTRKCFPNCISNIIWQHKAVPKTCIVIRYIDRVRLKQTN